MTAPAAAPVRPRRAPRPRVPRQPVAEPLPEPEPPRRRRRSTRTRRLTLPARLRLQIAACLLLIAALGGVAASSALHAQGTWSAVTGRDAPQVVDASALYQALTDLDAQTADLLLFGSDPAFAKPRATALAQYATDRSAADRDLQRATLDAAGDPSVQQALASVLDGMGRYQDLAARATALDDQAHAPAGHPSAAALADYRQALGLLRGSLLPAADRLVQADNAAYQRRYAAESSTLSADEAWGLVLGLGTIGALIGCQVWLAVRFRRVLNPALIAATVLGAVLLGLFAGLCGEQRAQLRVARHDAFDSVVALIRARAISYDANADESRYLLDASNGPGYAADFQYASQRLATLPGSSLATYDLALAGALDAYHAKGTLAVGGFYGTEFANITFPGERAAAETMIARYQAYEADDRRLRALASAGRLTDAITYDTGASNSAFYQYDTALGSLISLNETAFASAAGTATRELNSRLPTMAACAAAAIVLTVVGARPRLREFR
jgi:hypothetical protein